MVTKWKNISEKWCGKRRKRILLWGAVLGLLVLFFGSLGFVTSGGMGLRSFSYLMDDHYLNSKRHAEEVRDAFQEVRDKCLDDTRRNISNEDWAFQGIYEFRRTGASRFNQNNIPKEAYETFIRELWKEVSAETGSKEREAGCREGQYPKRRGALVFQKQYALFLQMGWRELQRVRRRCLALRGDAW